MKLYLYIFALIVLLSSCSNNPKASDTKVYFDIRSFFESEATRLKKTNPFIEKQVMQNVDQEIKRLRIQDWNNELNLFIESDINKPSWRKSYAISNTRNETVYTAMEDKLRTRKVVIEKSIRGEVIHIYIQNHTQNLLYTSSETLNYYPDSLYQISKQQEVRLLGTNNYSISGKF